MVHVNFEFDDELTNELRHVNRNLVDKATLRALKSIAKPVLNTVRDYTPVDTGLLKTDMSMTGFINNKNRDVAVVYVGLSKKNHPKWKIIKGLAVEYGNDRVESQAFLRRAAMRHREPVYSEFRAFLRAHLDRLL